MRAYQINITLPDGTLFVPPSSAPTGAAYSYSSFVGNTVLPNALNVEFDFPNVAYHAVDGGSGQFCRIWGVSLQEIAQATQLNGSTISIYGGFKKGLPLENPSQFGLLVQGSIFQAFGNWIGTEQSLDLILTPSTGTYYQTPEYSDTGQLNFVLNWLKGMPLSTALAASLATALPLNTTNIIISPNIVANYDQQHVVGTLKELAEFVFIASKRIIKTPSYPGVQITITGTTINVFDGTTPLGAAINIQFNELIGQPTWISFTQIQFKCPLRSDIQLGNYITLPPKIPTILTPQSFASARSASVFQGTFRITDVHHFGNFRQPTAEAWVTVFTATTNG